MLSRQYAQEQTAKSSILEVRQLKDSRMNATIFARTETQAITKMRFFLSRYGYKTTERIKAFQDPVNPFIYTVVFYPSFAKSGYPANGHSRIRLVEIIKNSEKERLGLFYQG